jgi:DUF1365 family protein
VHSCIYEGIVRHRRLAPIAHAFRYQLFMMYLDLDELPSLFENRWLWSVKRPAPARFHRADYLGSPDVTLAEAVRREVARLTGGRPRGPIRMLTHLRYFGFSMNPVTFYYCFAPDGRRVETILAEITNTPWKERHTYALSSVRPHLGVCDERHRFTKSFHVSPFMPMDQEYEWIFGEPGRRLHVHMTNRVGGERVFDASLVLARREISGTALAGVLARHPWMTARVAAGIYWQALRLRLKRAPYHEHPRSRAA